jgi:hypothetical protein
MNPVFSLHEIIDVFQVDNKPHYECKYLCIYFWDFGTGQTPRTLVIVIGCSPKAGSGESLTDGRR